jgi:hypothetical protein
MKKIIFTFIASVAFYLAPAQSLSPDLISTSGDSFVSANTSMSWSLGEIEIETFSVSSILFTQGFQQPDYNTTSIKDDGSLQNFSVNLYPNPVGNYLVIENNSGSDKFTYQLFDVCGKLVKTLEPTPSNASTVQMDLSGLSQGNYIIQIKNFDKNFLKSYKIVKF